MINFVLLESLGLLINESLTAAALNEQAQTKTIFSKELRSITDNNHQHLFQCFDCV